MTRQQITIISAKWYQPRLAYRIWRLRRRLDRLKRRHMSQVAWRTDDLGINYTWAQHKATGQIGSIVSATDSTVTVHVVRDGRIDRASTETWSMSDIHKIR